MRTTMQKDPPRSIIVTADMMKPSLAEAFTRWKELGEYPPDGMLVKLGGNCWGGATLTNVVTGEVTDAYDEALETLTHVQVKNALPSQRFFLIIRKSG